MQIFNLGIGEVLFVLLIAVIVLGPERIVTSSRRAGRWIHAVTSNRVWHDIVATSNELREIPYQLMEESGLREDLDKIQTGISSVDREINTELIKPHEKTVLFSASSFAPTGDQGMGELPSPVFAGKENITG